MIVIEDVNVCQWLIDAMLADGLTHEQIRHNVRLYKTRRGYLGTQRAFQHTFGKWAYAGKVDES